MVNLQKGLVGHWTMDSIDVDNGMIRDRSGYDNHGTINGATPGYSGKVGRDFDFDGTDDVITTANFSPETHTLSCWLNSDQSSYGTASDNSLIWGYYDGDDDK